MYIMLLLSKYVITKCLVYKSVSGKYFVKEEEISSHKCVNGTFLKSSLNTEVYCLTKHYKFAKNDTLSCVETIIDSRRPQSQDYSLDSEECKCGIANEQGSNRNRIMFPTNVKKDTYPWVVQMFNYCESTIHCPC